MKSGKSEQYDAERNDICSHPPGTVKVEDHLAQVMRQTAPYTQKQVARWLASNCVINSG